MNTALGRSARLVRRRYWSVVGVLVLVGIVDLALSVGLGALATLAAALPWGWLVAGVVGSIDAVVTGAFSAAALVLLYLDLRARVEGLDVEMGAGAVFG